MKPKRSMCDDYGHCWKYLSLVPNDHDTGGNMPHEEHYRCCVCGMHYYFSYFAHKVVPGNNESTT